MGVFDYYKGPREVAVQLKVGENTLSTYRIGDVSPIPDGVYIGHEGAVTVWAGVIVGVTDRVFTKWGDELATRDLLFPHDEVAQAVAEFRTELDT